MAATEVYPKLPDDVPKARWQTWPRRAEIHLLYNVRKRMVTNRCAAGTFTCYSCPDETIRIPIEQVESAFGQRAETVAAGSAAEAKVRNTAAQRLSDAELDLDDPVVGMFRECRIMLKEEREHSRAQIAARDQINLEQLKLLTNPVAKAVEILQATAERLAERVNFLETSRDAVAREREEMAEFRHVRDLEIRKAEAAEQRRSATLGMLKEQWPMLARAWASGSLRGFVQGVNPELVQLLISSGLLTAAQQAQLQSLLSEFERDAKAKAERDAKVEREREAQSNGAAATGAPRSEEQPS